MMVTTIYTGYGVTNVLASVFRITAGTNATGTAGTALHSRVIQATRSFADAIVIPGPTAEWGWWTAYYPRHPVTLPCVIVRPHKPIRAQARACRIDRNRWKRRRFLHALRDRA